MSESSRAVEQVRVIADEMRGLSNRATEVYRDQLGSAERVELPPFFSAVSSSVGVRLSAASADVLRKTMLDAGVDPECVKDGEIGNMLREYREKIKEEQVTKIRAALPEMGKSL